jgi:site-specific recombinase XerD
MKARLKLSAAVESYLIEAAADRLSPHTLADYRNSFRRLMAYLPDDPPIADLTADDLVGFFAHLAGVVAAPAGIAPRPARIISKKQQLNIHTGLSALWSWALRRGYVTEHIVRQVRRPNPEKPVIVPFSHDDLVRLLAACDASEAFTRPGQRIADYQRPTALRDKAILLLLLDTGLRASELCDLQLRHVDHRNSRITVTGKGTKERNLPLGPTCARALRDYIRTVRSDAAVNQPVFVGMRGEPFTRDALGKLVRRLGERAGVLDVHPHRFRHTFAVEYLRNHGNTRALQEALGHSTLEMIRIYTRLAEADLEAVHRIASPVENWRLK